MPAGTDPGESARPALDETQPWVDLATTEPAPAAAGRGSIRGRGALEPAGSTAADELRATEPTSPAAANGSKHGATASPPAGRRAAWDADSDSTPRRAGDESAPVGAPPIDGPESLFRPDQRAGELTVETILRRDPTGVIDDENPPPDVAEISATRERKAMVWFWATAGVMIAIVIVAVLLIIL